MLREIKLSDAAVHHKEDAMKWYAPRGRWALVSGSGGGKGDGDDDDDDGGGGGSSARSGGVPSPLPKLDNPMLVTVYGQLSLGARSYQSAICKQVNSLFFDSLLDSLTVTADLGRLPSACI